MRVHTFLHLAAALILSGTLTVAPARASDHQDRDALRLEIRDGLDKQVSLTIGGWVGDLVRAAIPTRVHCGGDSDERVVAVLQFLDRHGEGSRYTVFGDWNDGREITGSRDHGRFELRIGGGTSWHRHGRAHIEAPWAIAQCMMGRSISVRELLDGGDGGFDLLVSGERGEVRISVP